MAVLDTLTYTATGSAAYSTRKLRSAYAGSALRVVDSGGANPTDIGFTGEDLNITQLSTFIGSFGTAYVTTWYDQLTGANHATKTGTPSTVMPQISLTAIPGPSTKLAVRIASGVSILPPIGSAITTSILMNVVVSLDAGGSGQGIWGAANANGISMQTAATTIQLSVPGTAVVATATPTNYPTATVFISTATLDPSKNYAFFQDGSANGSGTSGSTYTLSSSTSIIGNDYLADAMTGWIGEIMFFNGGGLNSTDRGILEANQHTYWQLAPVATATLMGAICL